MSQHPLVSHEVRAPRREMRVSATEVAIEMVGVNKWFGDFHVLRDIDLKVMGRR